MPLLIKEKLFILLVPMFLLGSMLVLSNGMINFRNNSQLVPIADLSNRGEFMIGETQAYFLGEILNPSLNKNVVMDFNAYKTGGEVLAAAVNDDKWVEVDLTAQKLKAWEKNNLIYEFTVSTGKRQWGTATPVGVYRIWIKLRYAKMSGGEGSTYYYLPNVQCVQYFYQGYGIHGTYWHNNFGHPMSHGCVNMKNEDACALFYWTAPEISAGQYVSRPTEENIGTRIVVHGETPLN